MRMAHYLLAVAACAAIFAAACPAVAQEKLEPIKKVGIGKNREFIVNGKPFLPVMSWAQATRSYGMLRGLEFNTFCGTDKGKQAADAAQAAGGYVIPTFSQDLVGNPYVLAYIHGDEPDMPEKGKPKHNEDELAAYYNKVRKADSSRPVLMTFTAHFMSSKTDKYSESVKKKIYPAFVKHCDVVGFDTYPIYGSGMPCNLCDVGIGVAELCKIAGPKRPVYAWIETSKGSKWMTYEKQPDVLPIHTRAEVWMALIEGATAIGYFTHAWAPSFTEFAPTAEMRAELKRLNGQITTLAPAILAEPAKAKVSMKLSGDLNCHLKATDLDGTTYIFAQNLDLGPNADKLKQFQPISPRGGKATITVAGLAAGTTIEVVDENRTITSKAGQFEDEFNPLAEHVYKIGK
ncbi:MAG: hypothetical protein JXL80_01235 [Planctomycetes bacterium]|nr:hypothetical protein [Planctomycetota bacterium]